jgi:hypothetical protein
MTWLSSASGPGDEVVAVLATEQADEVAVCTRDARIFVYRLPKP